MRICTSKLRRMPLTMRGVTAKVPQVRVRSLDANLGPHEISKKKAPPSRVPQVRAVLRR